MSLELQFSYLTEYTYRITFPLEHNKIYKLVATKHSKSKTNAAHFATCVILHKSNEIDIPGTL